MGRTILPNFAACQTSVAISTAHLNEDWTSFPSFADRYCGEALNCLRASPNGPVWSESFYIDVHTNEVDQTNNAGALEVNMQRGFSLNWLQTPC